MRHKRLNCQIIAEVGQAHDGSLGLAHSFVDSVSKSGANTIKFQTHIAHAESTPHEPWRIRFSKQDKTRYNYWRRMEFSEQQWIELKNHANQVGLQFMSSPFSLEAVELLNRVGVHAWKIASGEFNNEELLQRVAGTGTDVYLSTGMSSIAEIDRSVNFFKSKGISTTVLQCTSMYPTPPEQIGLNMLNFFRERYGCNIGLSDHSGKIFPGLAAVTIGIEVLEVHVTFSKDISHPDASSSLTIDELQQLVKGIRFIERVVHNDVEKDILSKELEPIKDIFTKSLVYRNDIEEGTRISRQDICSKKPGTGVDPMHINNVLGKQLRRSVKADDLLCMSDLI